MKIETEKVVYYQLFPYLYDVILKYKDMVNFNFNVQVKKRKVVDTNVETPSKQGFQFKDLKRICVYLHYYDDEKLPFYVGQGTIQRAFNFISRNKLWKDKVKDLSKIKVDIFKIDISVEESINLEKELIDKYKIYNETVEKIIDEVARTFGVESDDIRSQKSRRANINKPRQIAIFIVRELTSLSMEAVGKEFGGRHYSTVVYTVQQVEKNMKDILVKKNPKYQELEEGGLI